MAEQQEQDRSEPASPFKLREARNKGQVAKSTETNSFFVLSAVLALLYFIGEELIAHQLEMSQSLFSCANLFALDTLSTMALFEATTHALLDAYWPFLAVIMVVAVLVNVAQTGPVFSFFPLKPDVQRLNPVQGFKRLFSMKLLFESVKTVIKLAVFSGVIYLVIVDLLPSMISLVDVNPRSYAGYLLDSIRGMLFELLLVILIVAAIDMLYTRWDYSKKMRMSRREVKDEVKRREGDPLVRAKLRELQREAIKRAGSLRRIPEADVLITNPTHLAVALRYDREVMKSPQVIAKGVGELAGKMRDVARRHGIPVIQNKPLARQLFKSCAIDSGIPENVYPLVARILVWVYSARGRRAMLQGAL